MACEFLPRTFDPCLTGHLAYWPRPTKNMSVYSDWFIVQ
jgi:hypothetical protein